MAGRNQVDDFQSVWVVSMGHLMGLHDASWLGIPATRKIAFLRYAEFCKVEDGKVVETAMFCDIPHLMIQAGVNPFPPQTAAHMVQPGPVTHSGLMNDVQAPAEGDKTLALINAMINDLGTWQSGLPLVDELARTWNDDMTWWGPAGIGSTYTIARYAEQHAGPFRASFTNRTGTGHLCRLAEGEFGGFFGWPNFSATATGGFMGLTPTGKAGEFRVVDIYRRGGEKLSENWVFIDLLHWLKGQGLDVLERLNASQ
jgi:predicted ester cyclase